MADVTEFRLDVQRNGYSPIPCAGKRPTIPDWQTKADVTAAEVRTWGGTNTGALTAYTPVFDVDVTDPEAAEIAEDVAKELLSDRGKLPVRVGQAPKLAIIFRTATPFPKMARSFEAPNGKVHRLEVLCSGQQVVIDGIHPDTKRPYTWRDDVAPQNTRRDELAEVTEEDMQALLELCGERLEAELGWKAKASYTNGHGHELDDDGGRVDVDARLAAMRFGDGLRQAQLSVAAALLCASVSFHEVVRRIFERTRQVAPADWDWDGERATIARMCVDWVNKKLELAYVMPAEAFETFERKRREGRNPYFTYRTDRGVQVASERGLGPRSCKLPAGASPAKGGNGGAGAPYPDLGLYMFKPVDEASLPPREWLYGRHYQRRTVSVTASPGGTGKTSLVMVEAVAMATARDLLGEQPLERLRVWYHNGEDSHEELDRRLVAICKHYGIPQHELTGQFVITSGNEFPLRVAKGYSDLKIDTPLVDHIRAQIAKHQIDVAILDPLITLHNVSESDNNRMDTVVRIFAGIADDLNCTFELEHHMRKLRAGDTDFDADDMRGASSIHDAVRAMRVLNHMSTGDAAQLAILEHERLQYFRVDKAKGNNAKASQAVWRCFVNVDLDNGDEVGVVVPYTLPGQGERTEAMAAAEATADRIFLELLARLRLAGITVNDKPRGHYAPRVFAKEPEARKARVGIAAFEDAMRRLIKDARVRVAHTTQRGREASYLEVVS